MKVSIPEAVFMIALDDKEGRLLAQAQKHMPYVLGGAALAELSLRGRLRFAQQKVYLQHAEGTGNRLLDHVLHTLPQKPKTVLHTLQFLVDHEKDLQEEAIELLLARGIVERKAMRLFFLPVDTRMQSANYAFEREIRQNIGRILSKKQDTTPAYTALFTLLVSVDLLKEIFPKKEAHVNAQKVAQDVLKTAPMDEGLRAALYEIQGFLLRK